MASVRKRSWKNPKTGEVKTAWQVSYADTFGKRKTETFQKKKDADEFRSKVHIEVNSGAHVSRRDSITVSQALDLWMDNNEKRVRAKDQLRMHTLRSMKSWVENHIRPTIGAKKLTDLTPSLIQAWIDDLAYRQDRPLSRASLGHVVGCLRLTVQFAFVRGKVARNILRENTFRLPGRKAVPRDIPQKSQIITFLAEFERKHWGGVAPYLKPMVMIALYAGLRKGEIRALRWCDVDFERQIIKVRRSADNLGNVDEPKSRAGIRDVPIARVLMGTLKEWRLRSGGRGEDLLFTTRGGQLIDGPSILESWHRLQFRAANGGRGRTKQLTGEFSFHALRHVCASLLIESGLPPKRVQTIMGHSSIQMTFDRYGHLFEDPDLVAGVMDKLGAELVS